MLDAVNGLEPDGKFAIELFLRYCRDWMAEALSISLTLSHFHPEQVAQIIQDEAPCLFCFINVQLFSESDLQMLRGFGFSQFESRVLFCGENQYFNERTYPAFATKLLPFLAGAVEEDGIFRWDPETQERGVGRANPVVSSRFA